jgi:hypothetical protein
MACCSIARSACDHPAVLPRFWPAAFVIVLSSTGCLRGHHSSLVSPRAPRVEQDFDLEQLPRYAPDVRAYTEAAEVSGNLDRAKYFRNKITDRYMGDIDHVYGEYTNALYIGRGFQSLEADFLNLGLTAASTISLVSNTKTILSALASAVAGVNLSFDKSFFGQQTFSALAIAMQARRDEGRASILANEQLGVMEYGLEAARRDLIAYFQAGTLPGALQEIQQEAALKSAATAAPSLAARPMQRSTQGLH